MSAQPTIDAAAAKKEIPVAIETTPKVEVPTPDVVEFKNVTKTFGDKTVLKDISFNIPDLPNEGELVAIVGQSGCGKSTLCKIIAGLGPHYPATTGGALAFGQPITGPSPDRGVVDQRYSLLPNLTTTQNIAFGLKVQGIGKKERTERAREWVLKMELGGSEEKYPHQLSGGMQQRVAIAASLILGPRILLMDEPFGALDPKIRSQMQTLLVKLWREQKSTVFIVTHSAEEACYLGDRVMRMRANPGTIAEIIPAPKPDRPLAEMRKDPEFRDLCDHIREKLEKQTD